MISCTGTRSRSVTNAADAKLANRPFRTARSLSTGVCQRSPLQDTMVLPPPWGFVLFLRQIEAMNNMGEMRICAGTTLLYTTHLWPAITSSKAAI